MKHACERPLMFTTFDGGTVDVAYAGAWADLHLRAPDGRTVATVRMSADDAVHLITHLGGYTESDMEESYRDGRYDAESEAA
ncbi:hypothetical protein [Streptomyces albipurpureus]|uniref:Uncharacterized protein n=1 Tax=Streptomyces albipurpureus TaxID=2897419 RepID=A0ABT0UT10_9ACTN|nr:hypothetical protein [Streptomyces sp. CWNU-1]MCM2391732.1 hypothetical protein [Streptomyces sp. CWNU-1]